MRADLLIKINNDKKMQEYLVNNSYWYKYLNRRGEYYKDFIEDMKEKYKLKPADKINKIMDNIQMVRTFLDVLK